MSWEKRAACRGADPELFFPERGDTYSVQAAKAVCARCPVRAECLEEHLGEKQGVWGGMSEYERRAIRRQDYRFRRFVDEVRQRREAS